MRLTYTDIRNAHLRNIGQSGSTDTDILADFNYNLGTRYQLVLSNLSSYINQDVDPITTVAGTQYYNYTPGFISLDNVSITIGSLTYTLSPIYDQATWNQLNALQFQPSAIPQFYFPRKLDFGIWPIPQGAYTLNPYTFMRDHNLSVEDYTEGAASITADDETVTGTGTFTEAMVGRWFTITDTTKPGQGYWYRVATYTDATHIELQAKWNATTVTSATYKIGESPELPEEAHVLLPDGTAADFYGGLRNTPDKATWWNNKFWTGDGNNNLRNVDENIKGGLLGLIKNYQDRDRSRLVYKTRRPMSPYWKVWASSIS
jgi:hypothetical protein